MRCHGRERRVAISVSVCLSVCLSVRPHIPIRSPRKGAMNVSVYLSVCLSVRPHVLIRSTRKEAEYCDECVPVSATQRRHGSRSAVRGDLEVPRCNLARYGQRSFNVSGPSLWNSLPLTVRDSSLTLTQFCTRLKTCLFTRAYGTSPQRLRDSLGCKDRCANINFLTYLLT